MTETGMMRFRSTRKEHPVKSHPGVVIDLTMPIVEGIAAYPSH